MFNKQGYPEAPDPFTGKAPDHQRNAMKGRGNDLSNAEIVPTRFKVYHGTDVKFKTFKNKFLGTAHGTAPINMTGFSFTDSIEVAQTFGKYIIEVELKMERPYIIDASGKDYSEFKHVINDTLERISPRKHDGVIIKNYSDGGKYGDCKISNHYIPFKLNQIMNFEYVSTPSQKSNTSNFNEEYLKERFLFNARRVWGDVIDKIHFKFTKRKFKKGHVLSLAYSSRPKAIRNVLISAPTEMNLYYSDSIFDYSKEDAEKIIIHEVIHIGYPDHTEEFMKQVVKFGGIKTISHLEGLGIQVQVKKRANKRGRFKTIMTFKDDEMDIAKDEADKYAREHRDEKVRLQY